jgi:Dual-action HEIGH metallo-peptidase
MRIAIASAVGALCLGLLSCGVEDSALPAEGQQQQPLSYPEFLSRVTFEPDTGVFVLNQDEIAETEAEVFEAYRGYVDQFRRGVARDGLIVNRVGGADDKWSSSTAQNLTYCISSASFGSRYSTMVSAMNSATAAWEGAGRVNFVHSSSLDGNCSRSTGVVFNVRQVSGQPYLARAFFPSSSRRSREVLIDSSSFGNISPYTLTGILRHELGHTLGFRHEHTRPEAGACFEDNNWRALTSYDSASVMHYPQCNGTNTGNLVLTTRDQQGAGALYP